MQEHKSDACQACADEAFVEKNFPTLDLTGCQPISARLEPITRLCRRHREGRVATEPDKPTPELEELAKVTAQYREHNDRVEASQRESEARMRAARRR